MTNCSSVQLQHTFQQFPLNIVTATKLSLSVLNQRFQNRLVFAMQSRLAKVLVRGDVFSMNTKGIYAGKKEKRIQKKKYDKAGKKEESAT